MLAYKNFLNEAAKKYAGLKELTPEESKALKNCLLDIYKHVAHVCMAHNLVIMLGGGSCLGAVRHQGFIPWDDDMDLMMPRTDYEQLIELCEQGKLGNDYFISYPNAKKDSPTMFLKVYRKNTMMKGLGGDTSPYPQECFIDIFPIEGIPENRIIRNLKGLLANAIRLIANMVAENVPLAEWEKGLYSADKSLFRLMYVRRFLGKCFSIIGHKTWVSWYDKLVRDTALNALVGIPTGRKLYNGEVFEASIFFPSRKGWFEGFEVCLPADTDSYLSNLYGSYMEIPSKEKRERHIVVDFQVPAQFYE